ncbi:hypothetical protein C8R45DRAFT_1102039 [Mycena sanguinolenta]|nr:hypothetical protein C8R45DRAFT_1102039 [Mycena sanguinolenta]
MPPSDMQLSAVLETKRILTNVGLTMATNVDDHDFQEIAHVLDGPLSSPPAAFTSYGDPYCPPAARAFNAEEARCGLDCIDRQTYVHALVEHPTGAIVEYPETGATKRSSLVCKLRQFEWKSIAPPDLDSLAEAQKEIFFKTLVLYCTLAENGCVFNLGSDNGDLAVSALVDTNPDESESESSESGSNSEEESGTRLGTQRIKDSQRKLAPRSLCKGKLVLRLDEYGQSFIQCCRAAALPARPYPTASHFDFSLDTYPRLIRASSLHIRASHDIPD